MFFKDGKLLFEVGKRKPLINCSKWSKEDLVLGDSMVRRVVLGSLVASFLMTSTQVEFYLVLNQIQNLKCY